MSASGSIDIPYRGQHIDAHRTNGRHEHEDERAEERRGDGERQDT